MNTSMRLVSEWTAVFQVSQFPLGFSSPKYSKTEPFMVSGTGKGQMSLLSHSQHCHSAE